MRRTWAALPILAALAACGDPLGGIERVSELPTALPESTSAAALPDIAEPDTPILAGLFRRNPARQPTDPAIEDAVREANGIAPVTTVDPVTLARPPAPAGTVETVARAPATAPADAEPIAATGTNRRGVLGWLRRAADGQAPVPENDGIAEPETAPILSSVAGLAVEPEKAAEVLDGVEVAALDTSDLAPEPAKRRGLFGLRSRREPSNTQENPRTGPDARDVALGTVLPFGEIARVCDAKARDMGKVVARAARKGIGYAMYDSAPDTPTPRTFYVTGFDDNCPRQFTAALALFGEPVMHEQLRYGLPARDFPYSDTDKAYEDVKARVCRVGRKKPCGLRIDRLEKTTTFVSVYENFGENARWNDILLHDGEVVAAALKSP